MTPLGKLTQGCFLFLEVVVVQDLREEYANDDGGPSSLL
jgi:hypothetical protein